MHFLWFEPKALARGALTMASSAYRDCSAIYLVAQCMAGCMHGSIMLIAGKGFNCVQSASTQAMRPMQLLQI